MYDYLKMADKNYGSNMSKLTVFQTFSINMFPKYSINVPGIQNIKVKEK